MAEEPKKPSSGFADIVNQFNEEQKKNPAYQEQVYREPYDIAGNFKKWNKEGYFPEVMTGAGAVGTGAIMARNYRNLVKDEFTQLKKAQKAEMAFQTKVASEQAQPFKGKTLVRQYVQTNPYQNIAGTPMYGEVGAEASAIPKMGTQATPNQGLVGMKKEELKALAKNNAKNRLFSWLHYVPDEIAQQKVPVANVRTAGGGTMAITPDMYEAGKTEATMAKSAQSLPNRMIREYIPRTVGALYSGAKSIMGSPVIGNTLKGTDAVLTIPNAINAYQSASSGAERYDASNAPMLAGAIAGAEPIARTAYNFYTGYAPEIAGFLANQTIGRGIALATGTPQSQRLEFDPLSFPYFMKGAPTLFNPYGGYGPFKDVGLQRSRQTTGMGGGTTVRLPVTQMANGTENIDFGITGPEGQIYGP